MQLAHTSAASSSDDGCEVSPFMFPQSASRTVTVDTIQVTGTGNVGVQVMEDRSFNLTQIMLPGSSASLKRLLFANPWYPKNLWPSYNLVSSDLKGPRQKKWYYVLSALVALTCIVCIVSATLFSFTYLWSSDEREEEDVREQVVSLASLSTLENANDKIEDIVSMHKGWYCLIGVLVALSCMNLVSTVIFIMNKVKCGTQSGPERNTFVPIELMPDGPRIMRRTFWLAQPPTRTLEVNDSPVRRIVVCHTGTEEYVTTPECILQTRYIQMFHVESKKYPDITFNFLVGGDGCVYEGRGWDKVGEYAPDIRGSLGVALIGTFTHRLPNTDQLEALKKLIEVGVRSRKISKDYKIVAHSQLMDTISPGSLLLQHMTTWPRFDTSLRFRSTTF